MKRGKWVVWLGEARTVPASCRDHSGSRRSASSSPPLPPPSLHPDQSLNETVWRTCGRWGGVSISGRAANWETTGDWRGAAVAYHERRGRDLPAHLAKTQFLEARWVEARRVVWTTAGDRTTGSCASASAGLMCRRAPAPVCLFRGERLRRAGGYFQRTMYIFPEGIEKYIYSWSRHAQDNIRA
eukprot:scaffold58121_cov74-Phaeocystis_antarctica.AAC.6